MAPKAALLRSALVDAAHEIFRANPDELTVNAVRSHAEDLLDLEAGFFKSGAWKNKLLEAAEGGGEEAAEVSKEDQRNNRADKKTKKTKKQEPAPKASVTGQDALGIDDSSVSPETKQPPQKRKLAERSITVPSREIQGGQDSDNVKETAKECADSGNGRPADNDERKPSTRRNNAKVGEEALKPGTSSPLSEVDSGNDVPGIKPKSKQAATDLVVDAGDVSDGSSTSVLDDTPPPKKKIKPLKQVPAKQVAHKATTATNSPDEVEVKKLQSQLAKCGVRKIWGIELKRFGDDAKAKIRQLKSMLHDLGMDGRFSEAKAREIKERRELMADLEEVQEMNRNWGVNGSGRASRSRMVKTPKEESSDEAEEREEGGEAEDSDAGMVVSGDIKSRTAGHGDSKEDDTDGDGDDGPKVKARGRQSARQADLAFLGSDSESD
ncbi:hypothetical protein CMQ_5428 [Grosmannia clavigera kw1407]|uniref:Transcriptional regulator n=1 Tax=Grosmannia clavigera (strain kw1407 / UAMH 11150) TaxID=655863 RepID=F0XG21_GROCL|nr:uncharacterized protein CMQ_5428 [Grosmannia clavigera kw1407]EFX03378.1 hypothetical protein CMQ_5428 [Grosmannia clavigera kw1407]